jgi:hypothetical protein
LDQLPGRKLAGPKTVSSDIETRNNYVVHDGSSRPFEITGQPSPEHTTIQARRWQTKSGGEGTVTKQDVAYKRKSNKISQHASGSASPSGESDAGEGVATTPYDISSGMNTRHQPAPGSVPLAPIKFRH